MGKLQQFYDKRYAKGLCIYCGKNPYTEGMKTCEVCRTKKKQKNSANHSSLTTPDGKMLNAEGAVMSVDDVLNSSQFLMCEK